MSNEDQRDPIVPEESGIPNQDAPRTEEELEPAMQPNQPIEGTEEVLGGLDGLFESFLAAAEDPDAVLEEAGLSGEELEATLAECRERAGAIIHLDRAVDGNLRAAVSGYATVDLPDLGSRWESPETLARDLFSVSRASVDDQEDRGITNAAYGVVHGAPSGYHSGSLGEHADLDQHVPELPAYDRKKTFVLVPFEETWVILALERAGALFEIEALVVQAIAAVGADSQRNHWPIRFESEALVRSPRGSERKVNPNGMTYVGKQAPGSGQIQVTVPGRASHSITLKLPA